MFQDLGQLLSMLSDPQMGPQLAAHLDSQGIPAPNMQGLMKLGVGGPQPDDPNPTQPTATGMPANSNDPGTGAETLNSGQSQLGSLMPGGTDTLGNNDPGGAALADPSGSKAMMKGLAGGASVLAKPNPMPGAPTGVNGGVKAPEHPTINPGVLQALAALLHGPTHTTSTAPSLGQLIK